MKISVSPGSLEVTGPEAPGGIPSAKVTEHLLHRELEGDECVGGGHRRPRQEAAMFRLKRPRWILSGSVCTGKEYRQTACRRIGGSGVLRGERIMTLL